MKLTDALKRYTKQNITPFHMPGHMRNPEFSHLLGIQSLDFTEVEGLDDMNAPEGILKDAMERAANRYGAKQAFFLVNGSTAGLLAAVYALCRGGKRLVMARNCHKSIYHAAILSGAEVRYLHPAADPLGFARSISPEEVAEAITDDTAAVILPSPTYEGIVSDIAGIAAVCHRRNVPLIVDDAHGAHLGFLDPAIPSPVSSGADLTVCSLHKTLPSLTQTGLLLLSGDLVDPDAVSAALGMFQTTSPSYLFMASIDGCIDVMGNPALFEDWKRRLVQIRETESPVLTMYRPAGVFAFDESKRILTAPGYTGDDIARILREEYRIEPEMVSLSYVLLMTGAGTTDAHTDALCRALRTFPEPTRPRTLPVLPALPRPDIVTSPAEGWNRPSHLVSLPEAKGAVAAEFVLAYPPGIPLIVPGERVPQEMTDLLRVLTEEGVRIVSSRGTFDGTLRILE